MQVWKSPSTGKTQGRASLQERDGRVYLQPLTELYPPQESMSPALQQRRLEIIQSGIGIVDPNTGNVILIREYQINSPENAWRLVMGSGGGQVNWTLTPAFNLDQSDSAINIFNHNSTPSSSTASQTNPMYYLNFSIIISLEG